MTSLILKPPPAGVRGSDDSGLGSHGVQATDFRQTAPGNHQVLTTFKYMFFLCQMHLQSSTRRLIIIDFSSVVSEESCKEKFSAFRNGKISSQNFH